MRLTTQDIVFLSHPKSRCSSVPCFLYREDSAVRNYNTPFFSRLLPTRKFTSHMYPSDVNGTECCRLLLTGISSAFSPINAAQQPRKDYSLCSLFFGVFVDACSVHAHTHTLHVFLEVACPNTACGLIFCCACIFREKKCNMTH